MHNLNVSKNKSFPGKHNACGGEYISTCFPWQKGTWKHNGQRCLR